MDEIWVVDDDQSIRWVLERALSREGWQVRSFSDAREVMSALDHAQPHAMLSDINMPGMSGIEMLQKIRERAPRLPVVIMTAYSDLDSAVSAFQSGAFEYLPKPFDLGQAVDLVRRALGERHATEEEPALEKDARDMLGSAPAMQEVFRAIGRLSQSAVTVLVTGESGTGKELIARALHQHSVRADKPFVALNMGAIPRDLLESELFGHERGSFTGAQQQRRGRFEQADGGTLFLDEIGDMPAEMQTRLLRVLSEGQFYRVGGQQPIRNNVRVIAATHQNLEERVRQGMFREDLFHRLNVIRLRIPPLRERREDVPVLSRHFLARAARDLGTETKRLGEDALALMMQFDWPGNVRQLENVCNWLTVMSPTQTVAPLDLPPEILSHATTPALPVQMHETLPEVMLAHATPAHATLPAGSAGSIGPEGSSASAHGQWAELLSREADALLSRADSGTPSGTPGLMDQLTRVFESTLIRAALKHTHGRRVEAAMRLGIGRNTITRKIQELGLDD